MARAAVSFREVAGLTAYARNARTHSDEQILEIAASMREWGWTMPVLIAEGCDGAVDGEIIAGHGRVLAAAAIYAAGGKIRLASGADIPPGQVPVVVARGWSEAQRRAYVIADNQIGLNAGWDEAILQMELVDLRDVGFDLSKIGFDDAELAGLLDVNLDPQADPDDVPEVPADPVSRRGDLWLLGRHRLLCGDCRDAADVARLGDGAKINLAFTSPPYAEQREYDSSSGFRPIRPDAYVEWFKPVATNVASHIATDGSWFINIKPSVDGLDTSLYVMDLVVAHVRQWGWHFATEFCWERNGVPKGVTQRFKNQFEPIYQFARGRWKMRPDAVRHESDNVPRAGGAGVGNTSWATSQGGNGAFFGAAKKRLHGVSGGSMEDIQGSNWQPREYIGPGLAYPGNRLPTFTSSHDATGHAAAFPVGLPEFFCSAFTDADDVVFDPFCGSGSTIIAAERTGRRGLACEISPAYVDVSVLRWQNVTGGVAMLEGDGRSFRTVAAERVPKTAEGPHETGPLLADA